MKLSTNKKKEKFKQKAKVVQAEEQQEQSGADQLSIAMMGRMFGEALKVIRELNQRVSDLEQRFTGINQRAKGTEFRSLAMLNVLEDEGKVTKGAVLDRVVNFHIDEFNLGSAQQDTKLNLSNADDASAEAGMFAIVTVNVFAADGSELIDDRIIRAKVVVGDEQELLAGFNEAVLGMTVGSTKDIALDGKTASVTLLGLRRAPAAQEG